MKYLCNYWSAEGGLREFVDGAKTEDEFSFHCINKNLSAVNAFLEAPP